MKNWDDTITFAPEAPPQLQPLLDEIEKFIEEVARPIEERHRALLEDERLHLEPDGRLSLPFHEARMEIRAASGRAGYFALHMPKEMGGGGLSLRDMMFVQEAVYRRGLGLVKEMLGWTDGPNPLLNHVQDPIRERYLPAIMSGEKSICFACTEPGAGSDIQSMQTRAERRNGGWVIRGHKAFITNAPFADYAQVIAQTDQGLTAFFVESDRPGFRRGQIRRLLIEDGNTGDLHFDDVWVPDENVIGEVGQGLQMAMVWINWARTRRGGMCAGLGRHLFERSLAYAKERKAFGRSIGDFGAVQRLLADMYIDISAARSLSLQCLEAIDRADPWRVRPDAATIRQISTMKVFNDEVLFRVADAAIQIHGAYGMTKEAGIEKIFRVARNLRIPAGTSEIQRWTIAKTFGL